MEDLSTKQLFALIFSSYESEASYDVDYCYDDMKIMFALYDSAAGTGIDYEYLCHLAITIRHLWNAAFAQKHKFPNTLKTIYGKAIWEIVKREEKYSELSHEEEGYSQAYAFKIEEDIVSRYLNFLHKN
jgi:hypothetical protein